jgi:hypothetical protein
MALTYRSSATASGTGTSLACNKPTGTADGDLLVAFVTHDSNAVTAFSSAGWTQREFRGPGATPPEDHGTAVLTKTASSEGASWTFAATGADSQEMDIVVVACNPDGGTLALDDTSPNGSDLADTLATGAIVPVASGLLLCGWSGDTVVTVSSPPTGMTLVATIGTAMVLSVWYENGVGAGSTTRSLTFSGSDGMIALAVAASASGGGAVGPGSYYAYYQNMVSEVT